MSLTIANAAYSILNQLDRDASVQMLLTMLSGTDILSHQAVKLIWEYPSLWMNGSYYHYV